MKSSFINISEMAHFENKILLTPKFVLNKGNQMRKCSALMIRDRFVTFHHMFLTKLIQDKLIFTTFMVSFCQAEKFGAKIFCNSFPTFHDIT